MIELEKAWSDSYFENRVLVYPNKDFKSTEPSPSSQRTLTIISSSKCG